MEEEIKTSVIDQPKPEAAKTEQMSAQQKRTVAFSILGLILILVFIVVSIYFLLTAEPSTTAQIRDVFIIVMAVVTLLIGMVLVILILQVARLINLLQNEIKPILDSTNETVSHLRGTTMFLSDNLVEPIMKMNEYFAGFFELLMTIGLFRRTRRNQKHKGE